jgi:hypothetical protein
MAAASSAPIAKRYAKALCHLNYARRMKRLGLILGAGVSDTLGIPQWKKLIDRIESQLGYLSGRAPEAYRAEQLFQHYKKKRTDELGWDSSERLDAAVIAGWRDVVTKCLYQNFRAKNGRLNETAYKKNIQEHPYLTHLGKLARDVVLVVTHNFDDALQVAIDLDPSVDADTPDGRRYHSFWRPEPFLRHGMVNIYHPNGYTPLRGSVRGSENLILTEASFADHLAHATTEESHFLLRHLADKTCLIIGHSLSDGTLKNALRQHANQRPGHINYYVHWNRHGEAGLSDDQREAIRQANFETYNLVTIFANSTDIAEFLRIVSMHEGELEGFLAHHSIVSRYVYYIVGAVSSGKSTTLRHLRDLATIEEWPRHMPVDMNRPSLGLKKTQEEKIDARLEDAIWRKNCEIREIKVGIVAVDRAPLDFIAFPTKKSETLGDTARKRRRAVLGRLDKTDLGDLCPGQVIVLQADPVVLVQRQLQRANRTTPEEAADGSAEQYLKRQRAILDKIYETAIDDRSVVKTDRCSIAVPAKDAARLIHFGDYAPFDFAGRLRAIQKGK